MSLSKQQALFYGFTRFSLILIAAKSYLYIKRKYAEKFKELSYIIHALSLISFYFFCTFIFGNTIVKMTKSAEGFLSSAVKGINQSDVNVHLILMIVYFIVTALQQFYMLEKIFLW